MTHIFYRSRAIALTVLLSFALVFSACTAARTPVPPGVVPQSKPPTVSEEQYGHEVLGGLTQRWQLDYSHPRANEVNKIVERLTAAAKADQEPWHVFILKDDTFKNAAATRGNHVFVWTGMINATQSEDELAAVLSHEISHVLARHTDPDPQEELRKILVQVGAAAAGMAAAYATRNPSYSRTVGDLTSSAAQEIGSGFLVNPYSRDKELEADQIGLFLMADAKYDPQGAVNFWSRAQSDPEFGSSLAFFSTHPPAGDRLEQLKRILPQAEARYKGIKDGARGSLAQGIAPSAAPQRPSAAVAQNASQAPAGAPPLGSSTFDPKADSFDMSNSPPPSTAPASQTPTSPPPQIFTPPPPPPAEQQPPALDRTGEQWVVIGQKAVLYSKPSSKSTPIGEFKNGAVVTVVNEFDNWLEIDRPDHGFLRRKALAPYADQLD
jgi:metalloendopeptidase OMA1, mitochondrial